MNHQNNSQKQTEVNPLEMEHYLIQQGFFRDEVSLPAEHSAQMGDLIVCARNYLKDKKLNHGRNPLVYLEAIAYCILHKSYKDLEEPQQRAITNFAELVADRVRS